MKYHKIPNLFENQSALVNGKEIGSGTIRYIQDSGQKVTGNTYIDRNTNELYLCVTTTNSVNNDGNFKKFNLKEAFNKLDNLGGELINITKGLFPQFTTKNSLKVLKNKSFYYIANDRRNIAGPASVFYVTPPKSNWDGWEVTVVYDGEDSTYRYYHFTKNGDNTDNTFILIQ